MNPTFPNPVKVETRALALVVNDRLKTSYSPAYIGSVRNGNKGSAALQDIVREEERRMITQAAAEATRTPILAPATEAR